MDGAASTGPRWGVRTAMAVLAHPSLWFTALRQVHLLARPAWWRRRPWLPLPDPAYLAFRLETQYGSSPEVDPGDVVTYLRWCRAYRAVR